MLPTIPLISTTVRAGHNAGDTFIGVGMQHLFERALGEQRWALIDRFSPDGYRQNEQIVKRAPFLVYGGMPQYNNYDDWMHWYDSKMWRQFILKWDKRVFAMAGGAGFRHPHIGVEEYVEYCLNSRTTERVIRQRVPACVCITVRDPYAHALLNALEIENAYLPCTATWASRMWNVSPSEERPYLLLVPPPPRYVVGQPSRSERRAAFARQWKALYDALKESGENVRVLCHELAEYDALLRAIPPDDLWFHGDSFTLLRQYASAHTVVSGRLHGSLPAYGIAGTRVVNVSVDVRGSAVEKFPKIENVSLDDATPETVLAALAALEPSDPTDLLPFENDTIDLIRRSVRDLSLN